MAVSPNSRSPIPSHDDSPFITPPSPPLAPTRPPWQGDASMRVGTQTLIQALQALPWASDQDHEDDIASHDPSALTPVTDEEEESDEEVIAPHMASSIHTIYRPVARSRKMSLTSRSRPRLHVSTLSPTEYSSDEIVQSDEEPDADDFEETTPKAPDPAAPSHLQLRSVSYVTQRQLGSSKLPEVVAMSRSGRSGSMATVRLQRRTKLAEKLRDIFELDGIEEVQAELPCWLLRSVLLQGYMYLTNSFLCFFAHMPSREDQILKSGSLNKKAQRTKRWVRHWFVLKNDALSWYQSSSDPYFPHGIVDLRYAISCEPSGERGFRVRTNQKSIVLSADSVPSREEWVKAIRKVMFKAQNMGDTVKIAIPYSAILDVDKSSALDFSETIEVKVYDKEAQEQFSIDSFFFAYFRDLPAALDQIRDAVRCRRTKGETSYTVLDTTATRNVAGPSGSTLPTSITSSNSLFRIPSILRPFSESRISSPSTTTSGTEPQHEEFTHITKRVHSSSFIPITTTISPTSLGDVEDDSLDTPIASTIIIDSRHTYPPSTSGSPVASTHLSIPQRSGTSNSASSSNGSSWAVNVPHWLKVPRTRNLFGGVADTLPVIPPRGEVREMYTSAATTSPISAGSKLGNGGDLTYSILETPDAPIDDDIAEKFRNYFAYDERETLLGHFPGYIYRLLPVYGRLYISLNHFCFKSSGPLTARTRMALPLRDILSVEKSKATRFGQHGLIVIVKGHEELFFEFGAEDKRDAFVRLIERQIDDVRRRLAEGEASLPTPGQRDALILEELDIHSYSPTAEEHRLSAPENLTDSLLAPMFSSSTFLTFKPQKSLHFTFLTIGSRGDVQPYIALAKGLQADGHKVRIATHKEFKEWIEAHDIEYGYVGGDPAELMRICVENGMFTVSFLKEGLQKFRGWLDDLLKTAWEACQGTDVLVESPSAMGGYHIAEALAIPYFRAFTMTWTRTRAYPHAFAVPERKMGGSYNYMSYVMFDQVFWHAISGQINRWRRNILHIESTNLDKMEPHKIPFLYNFSPSVVPPPLDWPEWIRITGYWFLDDADVSSKKWTPPETLSKFIDTAHSAGKKVVYIGFGSIVVSDPVAMTKCVVEAVVQSGVCAILSKGWSDRLQVKSGEAGNVEEPLPDQIYPISSIPHDWLFQRIDAACHHGGAGTTGASLRAGIPTIIKPFFGDQYFWADRVEALGVGSGVRRLTVDSLTEALRVATTDSKQISRANALGEQIRKENGVDTAIESIYRDLEYARSLIKRPIELDSDGGVTDIENSTIRQPPSSAEPKSGYSSNGSVHGAPSDWSVISERGDPSRRSSISSTFSGTSEDRPSKRSSIAAAMLSVLPNSLTPGSPRKRTISTPSQS
ncbi:glycosyltransferase family 1 protein [Lentinula edodes]|uniref:Sterol 3-beta-glucosyltransferase n=1 Tax=Lentinula lateritia TaxID=40482 RepID=A0A9W9ASR5_9AGAR|nr:glycosyltransferase family 1 protein [Lentinula edodes]